MMTEIKQMLDFNTFRGWNLFKGLFFVLGWVILAYALPTAALAQTSPLNYTTADTFTFTVPDGVKTITVETWGGG